MQDTFFGKLEHCCHLLLLAARELGPRPPYLKHGLILLDN